MIDSIINAVEIIGGLAGIASLAWIIYEEAWAPVTWWLSGIGKRH